LEVSTQRWQEGVELEVSLGCSLKELLTKQLHIPEDYLQKRIAVIFLNGSPVDDIDSTWVGDGAVIAHSAQMPGLVGAAMSRKGLISPLRSSISARTEPINSNGRGTIRLKLFNALIDELGSTLLKHISTTK
jgi:hypothetical protein